MRTTAEGRANPQLYSANPPAFFRNQRQLFSTRPLYPALASLLPLPAPVALKAVSAVSYVLVPALVFAIMLVVGPPWIAALGAVGIATVPLVYELAGLALTDELALLFWIATLGGLLAYLRRPSTLALAALILAAAGLTFARPAIYLALGAALGAFIGAMRSDGRRAAGTALIALLGVGIAFFAYSIAFHGPGIAAELRWGYDWQRTVHGQFTAHGFATWWMLSVANSLSKAPIVVYRNLGPFTIILAGFGLLLGWRSIVAPVAVGGIAATLVAILANPFEFALERTVTLPVSPIVVMLGTLALAALAKLIHEGRSQAAMLPLGLIPQRGRRM
ncbi:MAG: hypothetical protein ACXWNK_09280 [Vulcanimicrobiaceae bacterium]